MRIRTQVVLSGTLACASILCLVTGTGWSQTNPPSQASDSTAGERGEKAQEILFSAQQLQEQHRQLLRALDLVRRDAEANFQRHAATVDRIRKDTEASLQRFGAAIDAKVDFLGQTFAAARERELKALQRSNRFAFTVASILVGVLLLEILLAAWISVRSVNRLAATMSALFAAPSPFPGAQFVLQTHAAELAPGDLIRETNARLQNALDRLERRLLDLDHAAGQSSTAAQLPHTQGPMASSLPVGPKILAPKPAKASGVSLTLGAGESLIFLPHEKGITQFRSWRNSLQKLWKRFQPARIAKSH